MAINKDNKELVEFKASGGDNETADPVAKDGHKGRSADKSNGEAPTTFATKAEAISAAIEVMSGMPKEKIGDIYKGLTDGLSAEKSKATRRLGTATDDASGEAPRSSGTQVAAEDMEVIFDGQELSEEIRDRAKIIFEAALNTRVYVEVARLEEEFETKLEEALEDKVTQLTENVDKYLSYAVEQWVSDNEIAIESGLKAEVVEDFIGGLKNLFAENYVEIPDDKIDLVSELTQHVAELEKKINDVVKENVELTDYVDSLEVDNIFAEAVEALPLTQQEKLRSLVEGIEYADAAEFTKKLNVIKESFFSEGKKEVSSASTLTEATEDNSDEENTQSTTGTMSHYVKAISQTTKK
jgi:hypothetical protein